MKNTIIEAFKQYITSRYLLVLSASLILLATGFIVYVISNVHPGDLQLVVRCSAFGVTHSYRDQWFYLLSFAAFGLIVAITHVILTVKVYLMKGESLAVGFAWLGIVMVLLAWTTAYPVINILNYGDCRISNVR